MRKITYRQALNEAIYEEMDRDVTVFVMGEDVALYGGIFKVTEGLLDKFGQDRVRDTPLSETAIIGGGVGAAITGMRPICELMLADFVSVCFDEIINKAAKWKYMHGGVQNVPLVIRAPIGAKGGGGAEHSQSPEAFFLHAPGLKVVLPSTPYDAKGLLKSAIRDDDPVIFFEHKLLYSMEGEVPEEEYTIPLGSADVKREGTDVTVVATSLMVNKALSAAELLKDKGISAEVLDLRSLVPLDKEAIFGSVRKTGRLVIVHEAGKRGGSGAEISAIVSENIFDSLKAPVKRVAAPDVPIPYSCVLEKEYLPNEEKIINTVINICK
jgi:pyruvate/2-oxoglutarate/acetoin dehydrogenase E1 component